MTAHARPSRSDQHTNTGARGTPKLEAALAYGSRGFSVFPCAPGTKVPFRGSRGFKDANSDPDAIREWWREHPDANVAIATGSTSRTVVVDDDTYKPGAWTPQDIEAELGPLPRTTTVSTASGGLQYWYLLPGDEPFAGIPEGVLGPGVCVKAGGGYVLAPPSVTEGTYEFLDRAPLAPAPGWLLEAIRDRPKAARPGARGEPSATTGASVVGPKIPDGERNPTLTSIAGKLHDGRRTREQLRADLMAINLARCEPPMDRREVEKVADSIHGSEPCKPSVDVAPEVVAALDAIEEWMWEHPDRWRGKAGLSQWKIMYALVDAAREHGTAIPGGVRICLSYRDLAERAGVALSTVQNNLLRMRMEGEVRADNLGRREEEAGAFVLRVPERADPAHSPTNTELLRITEWASVPDLRVLKKLRHGAPNVWRLGPRAGMAVLALLRSGGVLTLEELADKLGVSRARDLRRRGGVLERMQSAGVIGCSQGRVSLTEGWLEALEGARRAGREEEAELLKQLLHGVERAKYAHRLHGSDETHWRYQDAVKAYQTMRERLR